MSRADDRDPLEPRDGIWPGEAEWLRWEPPAAPSPDFADRVLGAWRDERDADAADAVDLPRALLDAYTVPEPSADFVERTLAALRQPRAASAEEHGPSEEHGPPTDTGEGWAERLDAYGVPEPSADFVARTLRAIRADSETPVDADPGLGVDAVPSPRRRAERLTDRPSGAPSRGLLSFPAFWAAAAALVIGLGWFLWSGRTETGGPDPETLTVQVDRDAVVPAAASFSPTLSAVAMARGAEDDGSPVAAAPDPLLLLAQGGLGR